MLQRTNKCLNVVRHLVKINEVGRKWKIVQDKGLVYWIYKVAKDIIYSV